MNKKRATKFLKEKGIIKKGYKDFIISFYNPDRKINLAELLVEYTDWDYNTPK